MIRRILPICQVERLCEDFSPASIVTSVERYLRSQSEKHNSSSPKYSQRMFEQAEIVSNCLLQLSLHEEFVRNN